MFRYFTKAYPDQAFRNKATGKIIPVEKIDHMVGVLMVQNPAVIDAIQLAIKNNSGGWEEITEGRYNELLSQKKSDSKPQWREEFSNLTRRPGSKRVARMGVDPAGSRNPPDEVAVPNVSVPASQGYRPEARKL